MLKLNLRHLVLLTVLACSSLACAVGNLFEPTPSGGPIPMNTGPTPTRGGSILPGLIPPAATNTSVPPTPTLKPTEVPSSPIGMRQGLSSLNSFRLKIESTVNGPTSKDKNHSVNLIEYDKKTNATHSKTEMTVSTAKEPKEESNVSDIYKIGNKTCTVSGNSSDKPTVQEANPQQQEMSEAMSSLIDVTPFIEKPKFVGAETINGVKTNHFKFTVSGLGKDSGAEVTKSSGEYWIAQDGQYLVKYLVVMETRSAPKGNTKAQVMHSEFLIDLTDINKAIKITMPAKCK